MSGVQSSVMTIVVYGQFHVTRLCRSVLINIGNCAFMVLLYCIVCHTLRVLNLFNCCLLSTFSVFEHLICTCLLLLVFEHKNRCVWVSVCVS